VVLAGKPSVNPAVISAIIAKALATKSILRIMVFSFEYWFG
jgi:hypothetical protein